METTRYVKVAVIGDGSVGKSSIVESFRADDFIPIYKQTVGFDLFEKSISLQGIPCNLQISDIGGQSLHSKSLQDYIGSASAFLLVYDVTNAESFRNLDDWLHVTRKYSNAKAVYLVGNKVDMGVAMRQVDVNQHEKFIAENNLSGGIFCSAKTGDSVVRAFYKLSGHVLGIALSESELQKHDKVLKAFVSAEEDTGRTEWADEIEAEDRALEQKKAQTGKCGLMACAVS